MAISAVLPRRTPHRKTAGERGDIMFMIRRPKFAHQEQIDIIINVYPANSTRIYRYNSFPRGHAAHPF